MKRLADYQGEELFELMAEIGDDIAAIMTNPEGLSVLKDDKITVSEKTARFVVNTFKNSRKELERVLLAIDNTPLTGANIYLRTMLFIADVNGDSYGANFPDSSEQQTE